MPQPVFYYFASSKSLLLLSRLPAETEKSTQHVGSSWPDTTVGLGIVETDRTSIVIPIVLWSISLALSAVGKNVLYFNRYVGHQWWLMLENFTETNPDCITKWECWLLGRTSWTARGVYWTTLWKIKKDFKTFGSRKELPSFFHVDDSFCAKFIAELLHNFTVENRMEIW